LTDTLVAPGQRLAGRAEDGLFHDLLINQGRLGFLSKGTWREFPEKTSAQLLQLVKSSSAVAGTSLGKEILKAAGGEGPVPFSTLTFPSQVSRPQVASAGRRVFRRLLLDPEQPILGKSYDGTFRPIQMRNDGKAGYWTVDGWVNFPAATREELRQYLEATGREKK